MYFILVFLSGILNVMCNLSTVYYSIFLKLLSDLELLFIFLNWVVSLVHGYHGFTSHTGGLTAVLIISVLDVMSKMSSCLPFYTCEQGLVFLLESLVTCLHALTSYFTIQEISWNMKSNSGLQLGQILRKNIGDLEIVSPCLRRISYSVNPSLLGQGHFQYTIARYTYHLFHVSDVSPPPPIFLESPTYPSLTVLLVQRYISFGGVLDALAWLHIRHADGTLHFL